MLSSQKDFLSLFGWSDFFENQIHPLESNSIVPARVIGEERNLYRLQINLTQIVEATVSGKLKHKAMSRSDFPGVGDWVMVELSSNLDRGVIQEVLKRKSLVYRKQVGSSSDMQILSANVDFVFITTTLNSDLNFQRIERYLAIVWEGGAIPILLFTKADLYPEKVEVVMTEVRTHFPGVEVHSISMHQFESSEFFLRYMAKGSTSVFLGSSGVGKSTLVNFLIGSSQIKTQEVRDSDGKGRHTTTSRNLYMTRFGGLIIDTPGMREVQLSDHNEGVEAQFSDIEELLLRCRFRNCQHQSEPGCAIKEALHEGQIEEMRWRSFQKLKSEIRHEMRKQNKALAALDRKKWRKRSKESRQTKVQKTKHLVDTN